MKQGFLETLVQGQGSGSIPGGPMGPARHVQEVRRRGAPLLLPLFGQSGSKAGAWEKFLEHENRGGHRREVRDGEESIRAVRP